MLLGGFISTPDGYLTELDDEVALILQQLLGETITVLDAPSEQSFLSAIMVEDQRDEPEDPTLRILLPSMSEDPTEAQSLRAMTEDALRTQKSKRLEAIGEALSDIVTGANTSVLVPREHVWEWLSGLNDLRLVLAQRLGVESSEQTELWYDRIMSILEGAAESPAGGGEAAGDPTFAGRPAPSADVTDGGGSSAEPTRQAGPTSAGAPSEEAAGARTPQPPSGERSHALGNENKSQSNADNTARAFTREELIALVFLLVSWWQDSLLEAVQSEGSQSTL